MENFPRNTSLTTATTKHLSPVPFHEPTHSLQRTQVTGNTVVGIVVATQESVQIGHLFPNRQVSHPSHEVA